MYVRHLTANILKNSVVTKPLSRFIGANFIISESLKFEKYIPTTQTKCDFFFFN